MAPGPARDWVRAPVRVPALVPVLARVPVPVPALVPVPVPVLVRVLVLVPVPVPVRVRVRVPGSARACPSMRRDLPRRPTRQTERDFPPASTTCCDSCARYR